MKKMRIRKFFSLEFSDLIYIWLFGIFSDAIIILWDVVTIFKKYPLSV